MQENEKKLAALDSLKFITSGMTIGLGTGSTIKYLIYELSDKLKSKELKDIRCVSTSSKTNNLAKKLNLELLDLNEVIEIDLTIDGADEFDQNLNLIKGGGGALLREKIVASISKKVVIVTDSSKRVETLGKFKLPIEVFQFAYKVVVNKFKARGYNAYLRKNPDGTNFVSDNGNYIIDVSFEKIIDPYSLKSELENIPGIIDHGLFLDYADVVLMGENIKVIRFER